MNKEIKNKRLIYVVFLVSLLFFICNIFIFNRNGDHSLSPEEMIQLMQSKDFMNSALELLRQEKTIRGLEINFENDPNGTGLIGSDYSMITTTLGHLDAKRTSVNPDMAALICSIFLKQGLKSGDYVAIGSSASFPGLLLATLSACKILNLQPLTMVSVGASQYGANEMEFTIVDILQILEAAFGKTFRPVAISFGGNNDIADDLSDEARNFIRDKIQKSGYSLIFEDILEENVSTRMALYLEKAKSEIKMFVNIGGAISNTGSSPEILNLKPGLNELIENIPEKKSRGVLFEFALLKKPILHLLYIKGLSLRYNVLWDPIPFQDDSFLTINQIDTNEKKQFLIVFFIFIGVISSLIFLGKKSSI